MRLLLTLLSILLSFPLFAQSESMDSLAERLKLQRSLFPQEKIHIMTDRELYRPGDTIWMRIWLVEGESLRPRYRGSRFVYSDLRDGTDKAVKWVKIKEHEGRFVGQMILPKELVSGDYTLTGYTFYLLDIAEEFIFRKTIHIISDKDAKKGFTALPLHEGYRPEAPVLQTSVSYHRRDTLTRVTFDVPDSTWFSISVTDDTMTPVDTSVTLSSMLPKVPDFFSLESVARDSLLYRPRVSLERTQNLTGRLTYRVGNRPYKAHLMNFTRPDIYTAQSDNKGYFHFRNIDYPDSTLFGFMVNSPKGKPVWEFELESFTPPLLISHLPSDAKSFYIKLSPDSIEADTLSKATKKTLDEKKKKLDEKVQAMLRTSEPDDIYTRSAIASRYTANLSEYKFYDIKEMILKFDGITFDGEVAKYMTNGRHVPVRFVVDTTEMPIEQDSLGKYLPQKALLFPVEVVYAVDFIPPHIARTIGRTEFPDSPIIRVDLKNVDELIFQAGVNDILKLQMPLGYAKRLMFPNLHIANAPRATRYWNPEVFSGTTGHVTLDLPLPNNRHTTYTLRAEGITPQGELVTKIYRIEK